MLLLRVVVCSLLLDHTKLVASEMYTCYHPAKDKLNRCRGLSSHPYVRANALGEAELTA